MGTRSRVPSLWKNQTPFTSLLSYGLEYGLNSISKDLRFNISIVPLGVSYSLQSLWVNNIETWPVIKGRPAGLVFNDASSPASIRKLFVFLVQCRNAHVHADFLCTPFIPAHSPSSPPPMWAKPTRPLIYTHFAAWKVEMRHLHSIVLVGKIIAANCRPANLPRLQGCEPGVA